MGYWKHKLEEDVAQNYDLPAESYVCPRCVTDEHLAALLASALTPNGCSFCNSRRAADIAVLLDEVRDLVVEEYADPAEVLPYDGREGGYQGEVHDGDDLVRDLDSWTESDELMDVAAEAFMGTQWSERNYFGLSQFQALSYGWSGFVRQIKHSTRFLFLQEQGDDHGSPEEIAPGQMLDALSSAFREFDLFKTIGAGTSLYRARVVKFDEFPSTAAELGTVPRHLAVMPNRMSPAGIPMFYGGLDEAAAAIETYEPGRSRKRQLALGQFRNTRPLRMLDLTSLPELPSQFDRVNRQKRGPISFLYEFARDITRPIVRDALAHVEYAPTQAVTEFVRHRIRDNAGNAVDGIMYRSSRRRSLTAVVIFADPEQCGPRECHPPRSAIILDFAGVRFAKPSEFARLWRKAS